MSVYRSKLLLAIALALIITAYAASMSSAAVAVGQKAPDFTLKNVSGGPDIKLSDFAGKPTLLVFYASWCPHCQAEAPVIQKIYTDLGAKGLNVVGIDVDQQMSDAQRFSKNYNLSYPNAFGNPETATAMLEAYGVSGVPMVYVLDKDGIVKDIHIGEVSEGTLRSELANLGVK